MQIQTIDEVCESTGIKICVYSDAGGGKTVLATTCGAPTIMLVNEAGLLSVKNLPAETKRHIGVIKVTSNEDVGRAYQYLASQKVCDWIVIDSGSEVCETLLASKKRGVKDARAAYGEMADEFLQMIRLFRDIPGYNVLMTFKQGRITDAITNVTTYGPMLPGKAAEIQIPYMFDEVFALRVEPDGEGNMVRVLQTGKDISYQCKDRSGRLAMFELANIAHIARKINAPIIETPTEQFVQPA